MRFLNKKAVEALPLRYIIIALVAALVVGIALQMTGTLSGGIQSTATKLNDTVTERTTCELDAEEPVITDDGTTCDDDDLNVKVIITDDCGVVLDEVGFYTNVTDDTNYDLTLDTGDENSGTWTYSGNNTEWDNEEISITVWANDKTTAENRGTETFTVSCT